MINFYPFEDDYPTLKLAALSEGFRDFHVMNMDISSVPLVLAKGKHDSLFVFTYNVTKTAFGLDRYFINCEVTLIYDPLDFSVPFFSVPEEWSKKGAIDENRVIDVPAFPDIWFGLIFSENRDKIQINGKVPHFYDISFNGLDYTFWYIEKDAVRAELVFSKTGDGSLSYASNETMGLGRNILI